MQLKIFFTVGGHLSKASTAKYIFTIFRSQTVILDLPQTNFGIKNKIQVF